MDLRYKVGELVELSASGRKLQQNDKVYDLIGIIIEHKRAPTRPHQWDRYPYIIQWVGMTGGGDGTFPMKEYEIKRVRVVR